MAYSKFVFFENLGQGGGTIPDYGSSPRTFEEDLALLTQSPDYSCIRRINAQVGSKSGGYHDVTIWVGIKTNFETIATENLTPTHVVEFVTLPCPPYVEPLIFFDKEGILNKLP